MKITSTMENFRFGLFAVSKIINRQAALPILGNILFEVRSGQFFMKSNNLEQAVVCKVRCKVEAEGSFCVSSKVINDLVTTLPDENIEIELIDNLLVVRCGKVVAKLKTMPDDDFPKLPEYDEGSFIEVEAAGFLKSLRKVAYAVSTSEVQAEMTGVLLGIEDSRLLLVATDRYRLAESTMMLSSPTEFVSKVIVPDKTVAEIIRFLSTNTNKLLISFSENQVVFSFDTIILISKIIDGSFPDYQRIIPAEYEVSIGFSTQDLIKALKTIAVFSGKDKLVRINVQYGGVVIISASNDEYGDGEAVLETDIKDKDVDIVVNWRYLMDFLTHTEGENVVLKYNNNTQPLMFLPVINENFRYLAMPVRI